MNPRYVLTVALVGAIGLIVLRLSLWRALLFVSPTSIRIDPEDPGAARDVPDALRASAAQLAQLGFVPLGTHSERPRFGPHTLCWNYVHPDDATVATLYEGRDGTPHLYFLSVLAGGGYAITANYRRAAREVPGRYVSGWLEDIPADRVYRAHTRRVASIEVAPPPSSLDARVDLQRAWYGGFGKSEVRQQNMQGLLWSLGSLGMVAAAIFAGVRR